MPSAGNSDYHTGAGYNGPFEPEFDRLFIAPAHYALVAYATLIEVGRMAPEGLKMFNKDWSRRVLSQGAVVLMITDGLDREGAEGVSEQMERLHKSCRRLICPLSLSGPASHSPSIRAPAPVTVRSMAASRLPLRSPARVCVSSRLRRVAASICIADDRAAFTGGRSSGRLPR